MDPRQIVTVQQTYAIVDARRDEFSDLFYAHLFDIAPQTRSMFPDDMGKQRQKLVDEMAFIVQSLDRLGDLVGRSRDLGVRHAQYGVEPHHYDLVLDAVIAGLGSILGDDFTAEVDIAWRQAYHLVAEIMLYGAAYGSPAV